MSEELGKTLFSQGYDRDGFILDFDIDTDMHLLNDYNSKEIAPCSEGTGMCDLNVFSDYDVFKFLIYLFVYLSSADGVTIAAEPQFVLISDDDIKKLKVDQLRQELKARGLDIRGLNNELKERLEKAMVNNIPMANIASEEEATQHVFGKRSILEETFSFGKTYQRPNSGHTVSPTNKR